MSAIIDKIKNKRKVLLGILLVALMPIYSLVFAFLVKLIFESGQVVGTFIRTVIEKGIC